MHFFVDNSFQTKLLKFLYFPSSPYQNATIITPIRLASAYQILSSISTNYVISFSKPLYYFCAVEKIILYMLLDG